METVTEYFGGAPKSLQMVTAATNLKDAYSLEGKYDQPRLLGPHVQGTAAARVQEGQEKLLHVQGQEG